MALLSTICFAQEKGTNDISCGVGFATTNDLLNSVDDIISDIFGVSTANISATPAISLTYKYTIMNDWLLYADGIYQTINNDLIKHDTIIGNANNRYYTIGFGTEYHYINKDWFQMYSGVSLAYTYQNSNFSQSSNIKDDTDNYFNFQVNAVGLRFGKQLAGVLELGFGYKGIANFGVSYQF